MIPFDKYAGDDENFYFAAQVSSDTDPNHIRKVLQAVPPSFANIAQYRLMAILFSNRIENIRVYFETTVQGIVQMADHQTHWLDGASIDPLVGLVMSDHNPMRIRSNPRLFIFSDGHVASAWDLGTLHQCVTTVWLNEPGTKCVTPYGQREEITLGP